MTTTDGLVLAVIPARGGSMGLPGKHLRLLGGIPLLAHTIRAARGARHVTHALVSTDDPRIRAAARRHGAEAPFLRPAELSTDTSPTTPVIRHAVEWFEEHRGRSVDLVVTLQPTSPLRTASQIDDAIDLLGQVGIDSAVSVIGTGLPVSVVGTATGGRWEALAPAKGDARRQVAIEVLRLTGGIYVSRRELLKEGRLLGDATAALVVDTESAIDIDSAADLRAARAAWRRRR